MTTTALKIVALIFMLIDHIGKFIPGTPIWFGWIGRISAPLFLFCVIWGFSYTSDKKKYLTRLYLFGVGMAVMNLVLNYLYNYTYDYITSNIFSTLFLVAFILYLIYKNEKKLYICFGIWQIVSFILFFFFLLKL
ncbi:TraX family protein [Pueribacillus theae]|uniref:TraX family protein n=1 Tax=Pueribacillus theae TaxID=2171751 RepID=UPI0023E8CEFF|nr:TraX family protein [Pueribacillus theae]